MRKILIILLIILLGYFGYASFANGMKIGNVEIISYDDVKNSYDQLDKEIQTIETKSAIEFENKKTTLNTSYNTLKGLKENYEEKIYSSFSQATDKTKNIFVYDIDFLWSRIGAHATNDEVEITLQLAQNSSGTTAVGNYSLCDFYFTVVGQYIDISTFLYDIEGDEELAFSIEEFKLVPSDKGLTATFKVSEVPLNKEDLTIISESGLSNYTEQTTNTMTNTNTTTNTNTAKQQSTNTVTNTTY